MSRIILQGRWSHRWRSGWALASTIAQVLARRAMGRPLVPGWSVAFEIGMLFYRRQFNHAFTLTDDMAACRGYFDALVTLLEPLPPVSITASEPGAPAGHWVVPQEVRSPVTLLYCHGGGYTFYAEVTRHFIARLADQLGVRVFALDYRLTPEHPHPAQRDDALAAYRWLLGQGVAPSQLVLAGDSAGGHLVLMLLAALRAAGLPQPALGMALSPWTDIGRRGPSQFGYDRYDMVQGYQTLQFGRWLQGPGNLPPAQLSPMGQSYADVAPLYLQAGGKEILVDMIRDFAGQVVQQGGRIRLDVWPDMTHEFHAYGNTLPQSREAMVQLGAVLAWATAGAAVAPRPCLAHTEVDTLALPPG